jgi:hypothetical protein
MALASPLVGVGSTLSRKLCAGSRVGCATNAVALLPPSIRESRISCLCPLSSAVLSQSSGSGPCLPRERTFYAAPSSPEDELAVASSLLSIGDNK